MELKIKNSEWSAGLPVAMVHRKTAEKLGVHAGDRIVIKTISKKPEEIITLLDTTTRSIDQEHIMLSSETKKRLDLKDGQKVEVFFSNNPISVLYIKEKIGGKELSEDKIERIIADVVNNSLNEPEIAVFISAMYKNGMTRKETIALVKSILDSGKSMKFKNKYVVDKHCIGGIAGNRTTPVVVSICAAAGLTMPKTSSRAITSAAGTADCIEVLCSVDWEMNKIKKIVEKTGACLTWGGSLGMVPADAKIIKVEKMLKIDPTAQLLASIMSKKLAAGSKYILIDIPYGKRAKVTKSKGKILKKSFEELGKHFKVKIKVILTKANEPIGNGVGPALEMIDVMKVLDPTKNGPEDLKNKSLYLAGEIFEMTGKSKKGEGKELAKKILDSGKAWEKFKEIIKAQKGKVVDLTPGKFRQDILAPKSGKIKQIHNKLINELARTAGCPQDKFSGIYLYKHIGDKVKKDEPLMTIYAESEARLNEAVKFYNDTKSIKM